MGAIPEGIYIAWNLPASEITDRAKKLIEKSRASYDEVGSLAMSDVDVKNVLLVRIFVTVSLKESSVSHNFTVII